jgi:hypothetical protein
MTSPIPTCLLALGFFLIPLPPLAAAEPPWQAQWIGTPGETPGGAWTCFRKDFTLTEKPSVARARIAVDSKYWLWINGKLAIYEGGLKRGPNREDTYFDRVDLAPFLREGVNTIAALAWYWGKDGFSHKSSGKAGFGFDRVVNESSAATLQHDDPYCANRLLFDDWFFSSIAPISASLAPPTASETLKKTFTVAPCTWTFESR